MRAGMRRGSRTRRGFLRDAAVAATHVGQSLVIRGVLQFVGVSLGGALVGLGISLALVALALQKFVLQAPKEA